MLRQPTKAQSVPSTVLISAIESPGGSVLDEKTKELTNTSAAATTVKTTKPQTCITPKHSTRRFRFSKAHSVPSTVLISAIQESPGGSVLDEKTKELTNTSAAATTVKTTEPQICITPKHSTRRFRFNPPAFVRGRNSPRKSPPLSTPPSQLPAQEEEEVAPSSHVDDSCRGSVSMGVGLLSEVGDVENFTPSPLKTHCLEQPIIMNFSFKPNTLNFEEEEMRSYHEENDCTSSCKEDITVTTDSRPLRTLKTMMKDVKDEIMMIKDEIVKQPVVFRRALSSFLRVADLKMDIDTVSHATDVTSDDLNFPNFHFVSADPPPGIDADPQELWVALDDGAGAHAPIAPYAVLALAVTGREGLEDESMWTPDHKTARLLKNSADAAWFASAFQRDGNIVVNEDGQEKEILVWSGSFDHGCYGSDLPAVRAAGIIQMAPEALMGLLVDSNRVKEYNMLSLGRTDLLKLQDDMAKDGPFGGITKVMRSETKPPMVGKMEFTSILHVREMEDESGFILVTRAVTSPAEPGARNTLKSEILLGVNIIKRIDGDANKCLLLTVNHIRSPMVPLMIAKRIGLSAAVNYFHDLRKCC